MTNNIFIGNLCNHHLAEACLQICKLGIPDHASCACESRMESQIKIYVELATNSFPLHFSSTPVNFRTEVENQNWLLTWNVTVERERESQDFQVSQLLLWRCWLWICPLYLIQDQNSRGQKVSFLGCDCNAGKHNYWRDSQMNSPQQLSKEGLKKKWRRKLLDREVSDYCWLCHEEEACQDILRGVSVKILHNHPSLSFAHWQSPLVSSMISHNAMIWSYGQQMKRKSYHHIMIRH